VRELPGKLDRFACRFAEFSRETPENRVLAAALHVVLRAAPERPDLRASAARCLREVGCSEAPRLEQRDLAAARVSAATRHYRVPLALARLLVESLSAGHRPAAGFRAVKSPSLLVEMPRLFERFVCRTLQRGLAGDARVRSAGHSVPLDDGSHAMLTPDAVVEGRDGPLCVVDAKYKPEPTDRHEPSASDLYQMLAYCVGYDVGHAVLVYPRRMDASPVRIRREGFTAEIHPLGLDLSSEAHTLVPNGRALCERIRELIGLPPDDRARPVIALGGR
jgi:5-methylcytosine-specific restriction enzyme subunit McrC